ncbi:hypothetical protein ACLKA6_007272 [Drosophila palustris]
MTTDDDGDDGDDDTDDVSQYKMEDQSTCSIEHILAWPETLPVRRNVITPMPFCTHTDQRPKTKDQQQQQEQEHHHHNKDIVVLGDGVCPAANGARWVAFYISLDFMRFTLC